jgi:hypothetical protein
MGNKKTNNNQMNDTKNYSIDCIVYGMDSWMTAQQKKMQQETFFDFSHTKSYTST